LNPNLMEGESMAKPIDKSSAILTEDAERPLPPVAAHPNESNGLHLGKNDAWLSTLREHQGGHGASNWAADLAAGANAGPVDLVPGSGHQDVLVHHPVGPLHGADVKGGAQIGGGDTTGGYTPGPYTAGSSGAYNITIAFNGSWTEPLYLAFKEAADLLCKVIVGDVQDVFFRGRVIDDLVITAELAPIDGVGGVLGQSGPTALRAGSFLPATAKMQFDIADAQDLLASGEWNDVVLHEMMHSVGFGSIWDYKNLVREDPSTPALDYFYTGGYGKAVYGAEIPVQGGDIPGTSRSHWDEETFGNELMTGYINGSTYVDAMTWASLADLGYTLAKDPTSYQDYYVV
jgi:hypothetical protein